jgi:hypothetical protein
MATRYCGFPIEILSELGKLEKLHYKEGVRVFLLDLPRQTFLLTSQRECRCQVPFEESFSGAQITTIAPRAGVDSAVSDMPCLQSSSRIL